MGKSGNAAFFEVQNEENIKNALGLVTNGKGTCLYAYTESASAYGGIFEISNVNNQHNALFVKTNGQFSALNCYSADNGKAAQFRSDNANTKNPTVYIESNTPMSNLSIFQNGAGRGIEVSVSESINKNVGIGVWHKGSGIALYAENQATDGTPALIVTRVGADKTNLAEFNGDIWVKGNVKKSSSNFVIDHPLDPENKYLVHSMIESNEMKNFYDGTATFDSQGEAIITLPAWFEALNTKFNYQLTCIGGFAPVYISEKIKNSKFKIAGGKPGMEVSWQVTGIRQDAYAKANPLIVEQEKPQKDKGYYINPESYNLPSDRSITHSNKLHFTSNEVKADIENNTGAMIEKSLDSKPAHFIKSEMQPIRSDTQNTNEK